MNSLIILVVMVASGAAAAPINYEDPGAWLTGELGLEDPEAATSAIKVLDNPWVSPKAPVDPEVDRDLLEKRDSLVKKLRNMEYAEAQEEIEQLLQDPRIAERRDTSLNMAEFELFLHEDKMIALKMQNKLIEALVEAQYLKQLCARPNGPNPALIEGLLELMEGDLEKSNNYARLQSSHLSKPEEVEKSSEKLQEILRQAGERMPQSKLYLDKVANIVQSAQSKLASDKVEQ